MKGEPDMSQKKNHVNRREFIVTGSLVVAGLSMPTIASAAKQTNSALPLSIGFLAQTGQTTFQAADGVLSGDPTLFSRGARFSFRGMQPFSSDDLSVFIDVLFKTDQGTFPFFALTHISRKKFRSTSNPANVTIDVPTQGTVDLSLTVRHGPGGDAVKVISFAVNTAGNALKLNRGTYIFAFTDRNLDWSTVRLADGANPATFITGAPPLLVRTNAGQEVNFDYAVLVVRAATS